MSYDNENGGRELQRSCFAGTDDSGDISCLEMTGATHHFPPALAVLELMLQQQEGSHDVITTAQYDHSLFCTVMNEQLISYLLTFLSMAT